MPHQLLWLTTNKHSFGNAFAYQALVEPTKSLSIDSALAEYLISYSSDRMVEENPAVADIEQLAVEEEKHEDPWDRIFRRLCRVTFTWDRDDPALSIGARMYGWTFIILSLMELFVSVALLCLGSKTLGTVSQIDCINTVIIKIIQGSVSIVLLIGVYTKRLKLVKIWLQTILITITLEAILTLVKFIYGSLNFDRVNNLSVIGVHVMAVGVEFWWLLVVKTYYIEQLDAA